MLKLSSSKSTVTSLAAIRKGKAGLSIRRKNLLQKVPDRNDWATFGHGTVSVIDLAYLTAATGDEFTLLRGKREDILIHGDSMHCFIAEALEEQLLSKKLTLLAHSHPGEDFPVPSSNDRLALRKLGQKSSLIISGRTGSIREYGQSQFHTY